MTKRRTSWIENADTAFYAVVVLWVVYLANFVIPLDLRQFGIQPRELRGLRGVLVSPLLHMDLGHLAANSGALFVLLALALSFSRDLAVTAILFVVVLGGGGVWLFGTGHTNVIGASGVVFGLLGFLLGIGLFRGEWRSLLLSSVVLCFYGGILLTLLHNTPGVSWLGHASGFVVGVLSAWWTRRFDR
jgi:membrane associated rhomboid family serine protease